MRICIVHSAGYVVIKRRAAALARLGHDVHVVSMVAEEIEGCTVHVVQVPERLARAKARFLIAAPGVFRTIRRINPDIVDFQSAITYGFYSLLPLGMPNVITLFGTDLYIHITKLRPLAWGVRAVLQQADLVIGSTPKIHDYVRKYVRTDLGDRLKTRPVGIPTRSIVADEAERRRRTREEFGVDDDTRVVMHSRHIAELWRVPVLIDAMEAVFAAHPKTELWMCYPPPNEPGEEMLAALRARVREMGAEDKVRFLGYHPYDHLISLMHAADLYVCIGTHDLLCSSILESLATRLVPIVSDIPAYHSVIEHDRNGFFVDPVDAETVSTRIIDVIERHAELQPALGEHNRELTVPRYDLDGSIEWTVQQYEEAIERRQRTGSLGRLRRLVS